MSILATPGEDLAEFPYCCRSSVPGGLHHCPGCRVGSSDEAVLVSDMEEKSILLPGIMHGAMLQSLVPGARKSIRSPLLLSEIFQGINSRVVIIGD